MKWKKIESSGFVPIKVKNHTTVFFENQMYIYGGFDGSKHKNCLHSFDLQQHTLTPVTTFGTLPSGRNGHTATLHNSRIFIIGGWNSSNIGTTKEIFSLSLSTLTWEQIIPSGAPMVSCNMHTANLFNDRIYVFRGGDGTNYLNDLHFFDLKDHSWNTMANKGAVPTQRANHASAILDENLWIFGGWNGIDRLNDMYAFSFRSEEWRKITPFGIVPKPRAGMSLSTVRGEILMFGGSGVSSTSYNDLFRFDSKLCQWAECQQFDEIPSSRAGHSLTLFSSRELLLIGGSSGTSYSDTYYILDLDPPPQPSAPLPCKSELNFSSLCNNQSYSDIQFIIEGRAIYAHKVIITRLSEHFSSMFSSGMRESLEGVVEFKNIRYSVFMTILKYLYTGEVEIGAGTEGQEVSLDLLLDILQTSDRFLIDAIRAKCERILVEKVNAENWLTIFNAVEHTSLGYLKEYLEWYSKNNMN